MKREDVYKKMLIDVLSCSEEDFTKLEKYYIVANCLNIKTEKEFIERFIYERKCDYLDYTKYLIDMITHVVVSKLIELGYVDDDDLAYKIEHFENLYTCTIHGRIHAGILTEKVCEAIYKAFQERKITFRLPVSKQEKLHRILRPVFDNELPYYLEFVKSRDEEVKAC